jgi:hypothetical protein
MLRAYITEKHKLLHNITYEPKYALNKINSLQVLNSYVFRYRAANLRDFLEQGYVNLGMLRPCRNN